MSGTVEDAKSVTQPVAEGTTKKTTRPSIATVIANGPAAADLLKQTVSAAEAKTVQTAASLSASKSHPSVRYVAIAACAMILGTAFGMVAAPKPASVETLGAIQSALDSSRAETAQLSSEVERLGKSLTALHETHETARSEIRALDTSVTARINASEQSVAKKLAGFVETVEKTNREQTAQIMTQIEKRTTQSSPVAATATITPVATAPAKPEPMATGTIADAKPTLETIVGWALRDVYDGVAILEDRKRRLIEVARGDVVPGVGRVEAVERRGRLWVVVTRQGIIKPQTW